MYYTGIDPLTMKSVYVATDYHEKQLQRALLQFNRPQNAPLVREALIKAGRADLIGYAPECLVRPESGNAVTSKSSFVRTHKASNASKQVSTHKKKSYGGKTVHQVNKNKHKSSFSKTSKKK